MAIILVRPGETETLIVQGIAAEVPSPTPPGPVDPGYSPPWAQVEPPVDPEHPWVPPVLPPEVVPPGPVDPGYSPPWAQIPEAPDGGPDKWSLVYSPKYDCWVYGRLPRPGEATPKKR